MYDVWQGLSFSMCALVSGSVIADSTIVFAHQQTTLLLYLHFWLKTQIFLSVCKKSTYTYILSLKKKTIPWKRGCMVTLILTLSNPIFLPTAYLPRNRKITTCAICWLKSVLHEEKRQTGSDSGAGAQTQQKNMSDVT